MATPMTCLAATATRCLHQVKTWLQRNPRVGTERSSEAGYASGRNLNAPCSTGGTTPIITRDPTVEWYRSLNQALKTLKAKLDPKPDEPLLWYFTKAFAGGFAIGFLYEGRPLLTRFATWTIGAALRHPYTSWAILIVAASLRTACYAANALSLFGWRGTLLALSNPGTPQIRPELRNTFASAPLPIGIKTSKTHPTASSQRNSAEYFHNHVATLTSHTVYHYQGTGRDHGARIPFWAKDLARPTMAQPLNSTDIISMVDVDYYIDMPTLMARHVHPYMLYTLVPTEAAKHTGQYTYTFGSDQQIRCSIAGGSSFTHPLWNYAFDTMSASWRIFGIPLKTAFYRVERRTSDPLHQHILFEPLGKRYWPFNLIAPDAAPLTPFHPVEGDTIHIVKHDKVGITHNVALVDQYVSANLPAVKYDCLTALSKHGVIAVQPATVQRYFPELEACRAAIVAAHFAKNARHRNTLVYPVEEAVNHYQFQPDKYDPNNKHTMVAFMSPLVHGAYAATRCRANEEVTVKTRVTDLVNTVHPSTRHLTWANEFVELMIPKPHRLVPVDHATVNERMPRPAQRHKFNEAMELCGEERYVAFQKTEAHPSPKEPRNITTIPSSTKVEYSRFMYALSDEIVKQQPWYGFGHPPTETAARVAEVCRNAIDHVTVTDFSRYDGTIGEMQRELEKLVLARAFHPKYLVEALHQHSRQYNQHCRTSNAVIYESLLSRLSGSPETSVFNSIANAYFMYCAFRALGCDPKSAYAQIGVVGGDDGLIADVPSEVLEATAKEQGLRLTATPVYVGELGVQFLSRQYTTEVWYGSTNSMCDLARQISKFHTTANHTDPPLVKLEQKLRAFSYTDANTPIFSQLIAAAERVGMDVHPKPDLNDELQEEMPEYVPYNVRAHPLGEQYPNVAHGDFSEIARRSLPEFDHAQFYKALKAARTPADLLSLPVCSPVELVANAKLPTVVAGEVLPPAPPRIISIAKVPLDRRRPAATNKAADTTAPAKLLDATVTTTTPTRVGAWKLKQAAGPRPTKRDAGRPRPKRPG